MYAVHKLSAALVGFSLMLLALAFAARGAGQQPADAVTDRLETLSANSPAERIHWRKLVVDPKFRAEGIAVADVNKDGRPDLLVGDLWYEAPKWTPHEIRPAGNYEPATGYSRAFNVFAQDVDRDGWVDEIVVGMPGEPGKWYRNPGRAGGPWREYPLTNAVCNESPLFGRLTGTQRPVLVAGSSSGTMAWWEPGPHPTDGFVIHPISQPKSPGADVFSHGLGIGDVDGDGRLDVLCTAGFYKGPANPTTSPWRFVPASLGPDCAQMCVLDLNGDGLPDVASSSAHNAGVWWHERIRGAGQTQFRRHVIDQSFTEAHSLVAADINGDRQPDLVTGKRWWAHGPTGDPDANGPAVLYWYEFRRNADGSVRWIRHEVDRDSGVGTQFQVADLDGDHRPDIAVANKKGVFVFLQTRRP